MSPATAQGLSGDTWLAAPLLDSAEVSVVAGSCMGQCWSSEERVGGALVGSPYPGVGQALTMVTNSRPGRQVLTGVKGRVRASKGEVHQQKEGDEQGGTRR